MSVHFRELTLNDVPTLFEIYSDREAMKFRGSGYMESLDDAILFVERNNICINDVRTHRQAIVLTKTDKLIGTFMLRHSIESSERCEIGYSIAKHYWGKGFGTMAVALMVEQIIEMQSFKLICAYSHKANLGSIRILRKNEFVIMEDSDNSDNCLLARKL